jgi:hypothetical protein
MFEWLEQDIRKNVEGINRGKATSNPGIFPEELSNITTNLTHETLFLYRDSNCVPVKYNSVTLLLSRLAR